MFFKNIKGDYIMKKIESPLKAIRAKCIDCSGGSANEVKLCTVNECELYPFRFGKNPFRKSNLSEEQKQQRAEHCRNISPFKTNSSE